MLNHSVAHALVVGSILGNHACALAQTQFQDVFGTHLVQDAVEDVECRVAQRPGARLLFLNQVLLAVTD